MKINNKAELGSAIIELEKRKILQEALLVSQFQTTRESLRPLNLIKDGFNRLTQMPGIENSILKTAAGVGVAFLSKKLIIGRSSSLLKRALATVIEFAVARSTISNADKIKAFGIAVYNNLFKKNNSKEHLNKE